MSAPPFHALSQMIITAVIRVVADAIDITLQEKDDGLTFTNASVFQQCRLSLLQLLPTTFIMPL